MKQYVTELGHQVGVVTMTTLPSFSWGGSGIGDHSVCDLQQGPHASALCPHL